MPLFAGESRPPARHTRSLALCAFLCLVGPARAGDPVAEFKRAWAAAGADPVAQAEAVTALARGGTLPCARLLARLALRQDIAASVREAAERSLFVLPSPEVDVWAGDGVSGGEKDPSLRVLLCRLLAFRSARDPRVGLLLIPALEDRQERVRVAAVEGLSTVRDKDVIAALVRCLTKARGRLRADAHRALRRLTGVEIASPDDWGPWWEAQREVFRFRSVGEDDGAEEDEGPARTVTRLEPPGRSGRTIFGGVASERVVFVVDVSGSMETRCQDSEGGSRSRLDYVRAELDAVLDGLDEATRFDLVAFSTQVRAWRGKLVRASAANKRKARGWLRRALRPDGETNIYGALEAAFRHRDADTIYFLSDGTPTAGEVTVGEEILARVRQWNSGRGVRVHTIGFLAGAPGPLVLEDKGMSKRFLAALAKATGGTFRAYE
ncbi:MAG: VWA domain-containing protein [Planctomycetota bacterium]|nr:MAG: VWA domain-containing protein [Planctomycetota bacterium]